MHYVPGAHPTDQCIFSLALIFSAPVLSEWVPAPSQPFSASLVHRDCSATAIWLQVQWLMYRATACFPSSNNSAPYSFHPWCCLKHIFYLCNSHSRPCQIQHSVDIIKIWLHTIASAAMSASALALVWNIRSEDIDEALLRALSTGPPGMTELLQEDKNNGICDPRCLDGIGGEPVWGARSHKAYGVCCAEGDLWCWTPTELGVAEVTSNAAEGVGV